MYAVPQVRAGCPLHQHHEFYTTWHCTSHQVVPQCACTFWRLAHSMHACMLTYLYKHTAKAPIACKGLAWLPCAQPSLPSVMHIRVAQIAVPRLHC